MPISGAGGSEVQGAGRKYTLTVNGIEFLDAIPTDDMPISWDDEANNSPGQMTFTVEDANPLWADRMPLPIGADVIFRDTTDAYPLFAGTITDVQHDKGVTGRYSEVTVDSYDSWLDWKQVPVFTSRRDTKRVRHISNDRNLVRKLINQRVPFLNPNRVDSTNTDMGTPFKSVGNSVRGVLEEIAEEANDDGTTRHFYVDHLKRFHWYKGTEGDAAPHRIAAASYPADVIADADVIEYWPMREPDPVNPPAVWTAAGAKGVGALTDAAGDTYKGLAYPELNVWGQGDYDGGLVNTPGYRPIGFNRVSGGLAAAAAVVTAWNARADTDEWAIEYWIRLTALGSTDKRLLLTYDAVTDTGPEIFIEGTTGEVFVNKRGGGGLDVKTSTGPFAESTAWAGGAILGTDWPWRHLMVSHNAAGTRVYINGVEQTLGTDNGLTYAASTATSLDPISGASGDLACQVHHIAVYGADKATAEVLARFQLGRSLIPDEHSYGENGDNEVHSVYVRGKNAKGSGWVRGSGSRWNGGTKQAIIDRKRAATVRQRNRSGRNYANRRGEIQSGQITLTGPDVTRGWRAGQLVTITDAAYGLDGTTKEIKGIRGRFGPDNRAEITLEYGAVKKRLLREIGYGK